MNEKEKDAAVYRYFMKVTMNEIKGWRQIYDGTINKDRYTFVFQRIMKGRIADES